MELLNCKAEHEAQGSDGEYTKGHDTWPSCFRNYNEAPSNGYGDPRFHSPTTDTAYTSQNATKDAMHNGNSPQHARPELSTNITHRCSYKTKNQNGHVTSDAHHISVFDKPTAYASKLLPCCRDQHVNVDNEHISEPPNLGNGHTSQLVDVGNGGCRNCSVRYSKEPKKAVRNGDARHLNEPTETERNVAGMTETENNGDLRHVTGLTETVKNGDLQRLLVFKETDRNGYVQHLTGPTEKEMNGDIRRVTGLTETGRIGDVRHVTGPTKTWTHGVHLKGPPKMEGGTQTGDKKRKTLSLPKRISNGITQGLERFFYNVGLVVGQHPKKTITACVIIPLLLAIGLVTFKQDEDIVAFLVPLSSRIPGNMKWVTDHMPYEFRTVSYIVEDDNVLSRKSIIAMLDLYTASLIIRVDGYAYTDICSGINGNCVVNSMLDLWRYNDTVIRALTDQEILETVDQTTVNPTYFTEFRADKILGHISRDENGRITGARAAMIVWSIISNATNVKHVDKFEKAMVELGKQGHADLKDVFIYYKDSFKHEFFEAVYTDIFLLFYGFPLVLLYLNVAFGKPNMVEHRCLMVFASLAGVLLSACCCYGICLAAGLKFGATHQALIFLLLAVGVDDSFVVMEAWKRVEKQHPKEPLHIQMALTMKHAGVSITVTSVSDVAAFAAGISTVMPILSSFCVYSAVGIIALYALQATLFPACLIIDQQRIKAKRDGFILCYVHQSWRPNRFSDIEFVEPFFRNIFGPVVLSVPGKIIIILITLGLTGTMTWSLTKINKGFVLERNIEENSYARKFLAAKTTFYPDIGFDIDIYCDNMNYSKNIVKLELMMERYKNSNAILEGTTLSWIIPFKNWLHVLAANGETLMLRKDGFPENAA